MRHTVDFDDELGRWTIEIDNAAANRVLKPELETIRPMPKDAPEQPLRKRQIAPQSPCPQDSIISLTRRRHYPSTILRMVPLPICR
jgi:hypothetical protein